MARRTRYACRMLVWRVLLSVRLPDAEPSDTSASGGTSALRRIRWWTKCLERGHNTNPDVWPQLTGQRRLAKLMTGQRTRMLVTSSVPLPAATAARISSSLLSSVGVTPAFQWKICRFQAPPA